MCETQVKDQDDKITGCKYSKEARPYMACRLCGRINHPHCAALSKIENGFYKSLWGELTPEEQESLCETPVKKINEIDWLPEDEVKKLKFWKEEIFKNMKETFDLLNDTDKLEAFLVLLSEKQRDELYSHPLVFGKDSYDLLP